MSTKFFASVRRNQKQWMVVVTVLSMVSFLFVDSIVDRGRQPLSPMGGALLIGVLCAAGMCIVGYPRQKTTEYGIGGFAVGFVAGLLGFGAMGINKPVVRTSVGNLTRKDFDQLHKERSKFNYFLNTIARKAQTPPPFFVGVDEGSLIDYQIWLAEAKKMGISISDERVNEFLKQLTQSRLSKAEFLDCLREVRIGSDELFDLLKKELSVQLAKGLTSPPAYMPPIPPGIEQYIRGSYDQLTYMQPTPYQLWSTYQKLTVKESLQAAAIPVRDFTRKVAEPTEASLTEFFGKYKGRYWDDEATPGFMEPPRVKLAYLTADFEKFEKGPDPTDQEVQDFYEANKERYRAPLAKESTAPKFPDSAEDAKKPEDPAPASDQAEKPPADNPDAAKKPEEPQKPKTDEKPSEDPKSKCGEEPTEKPASSKPADEKPAEQKPAAAEAATKEEAANPKSDADPKSESSIPKLSTSPESLPAPKYRDLNDELKLEIKEEIIRDRAFEKISTELDRAKEFMVNLGIDYDSTTEKTKKDEKAKAISDQLKKYAEEHKLEYVETKELKFEDLTSQDIGLAFHGRDREPVANEVFSQGPRGESMISIYAPRRADLKSHRAAFVYWKTAEIPASFADLKDEETRKRAISAWKFDQARPMAEKRALELLKKVKADGNDLPSALSGESVTGDKNDPAITVIPTDPFSWLSTVRSVPGASQDPQPTKIPLIEDISENFMKTVFEELNDGEVGMVHDDLKAVFYVVKVMNREYTQNDDGGVALREHEQKFMKEEFTSRIFPLVKSPYQAVAQHRQQEINEIRARSFQQSHQIDWDQSAIQVRAGR